MMEIFAKLFTMFQKSYIIAYIIGHIIGPQYATERDMLIQPAFTSSKLH